MNTPVPPRGGKGRGSSRPQSRPPARGGTQAAFQKKKRQQQMLFGGVGLVIVVVVVLIIVAVTSGSPSGGSDARPAASASVLQKLEGVSPQTLATQANNDKIAAYPTAITGPTLTEAGKPKVVYIGAEYCPYCGGERWAMIMALSKFGTFTGIKQITSSSTDNPSSIPSFSFLGSKYTSKYLVFDPTETETVTEKQLQIPSKANTALEAKYDAQSNSIPFVDFGNKWTITGASYDVTPMQHLDHQTVAQAASTASTKYGADIQAVAGVITSRLCNLTGGQPGNVCKSFPKVIGG